MPQTKSLIFITTATMLTVMIAGIVTLIAAIGASFHAAANAPASTLTRLTSPAPVATARNPEPTLPAGDPRAHHVPMAMPRKPATTPTPAPEYAFDDYFKVFTTRNDADPLADNLALHISARGGNVTVNGGHQHERVLRAIVPMA